MNDIVVVEVIDSVEDLFDSLGSILFRESSIIADAVEQFAPSSQLSDNIVFVLSSC